jgi:hypothetical protein
LLLLVVVGVDHLLEAAAAEVVIVRPLQGNPLVAERLRNLL